MYPDLGRGGLCGCLTPKEGYRADLTPPPYTGALGLHAERPTKECFFPTYKFQTYVFRKDYQEATKHVHAAEKYKCTYQNIRLRIYQKNSAKLNIALITRGPGALTLCLN